MRASSVLLAKSPPTCRRITATEYNVRSAAYTQAFLGNATSALVIVGFRAYGPLCMYVERRAPYVYIYTAQLRQLDDFEVIAMIDIDALQHTILQFPLTPII